MRRSAAAPCAAALCAVWASCAVGPDFKRPARPAETSFLREPPRSEAARFDRSRKLAADWWRIFGCAPLDAAVTEALSENPGLQAAQATLRRSEHLLAAGAGVFYPQLDARGAASRQRYNPTPGVAPAGTFSLFTLSGSVSYALDLFGGQRRAVEALSAQVEADRWALTGAQVMLAANVTNALVARAAYLAQREAVQESVRLVGEQLRIAEAQARAGTAPYVNALAVKSQLAALQALVPPLSQRIDQAEHLLALLRGRAPSAPAVPAVALADVALPRDLPLSLPSELVEQRPDILAAEARLHAANAEIGVATAAMLPGLTLSGSLGTNATAASGLFGAESGAWSLAASLTAPIFHGFALSEQRKAAVEAREATAAQYRETVLAAFAQVADALRALEHDADLLAAQDEAVRTAGEAVRLLQANYRAGIATYLQLLSADLVLLQAQIGQAQARAQRLQDAVALYAALGGGWWNGAGPHR